MNKKIDIKKINNDGMTLPELILAILMLTAFTAITVIVTQFTSRFFQERDSCQCHQIVFYRKPLLRKHN